MNIINNINLDEYLSEPSLTERCGVLFGRYEVGKIYLDAIEEVPNNSVNPNKFFEIAKSHFRVVQGLHPNEKPIGFFHTHVEKGNSDVSYQDVIGIPAFMLGMMLHIATKTITYYDNNGYITKGEA